MSAASASDWAPNRNVTSRSSLVLTAGSQTPYPLDQAAWFRQPRSGSPDQGVGFLRSGRIRRAQFGVAHGAMEGQLRQDFIVFSAKGKCFTGLRLHIGHFLH